MPGPGQTLGLASAGVQMAKAGYDLFDSIRKGRQANKILRNTKRPVYNRQREVDDVYNLNANELQSNSLQDSLTQQANQGLSSGIDAILKSGGKADFNSIYNTYGNNLGTIAGAISRDRANKIASYSTSAYNLATAKDAEWQYNIDAPYKDLMQQAALLKEQAAKSRGSAFTNASGALANAATMFTKPGEFPNGDDEVSRPGRSIPEAIQAGRRVGTLPTSAPATRRPAATMATTEEGGMDELFQQFQQWLDNGGANFDRK